MVASIQLGHPDTWGELLHNNEIDFVPDPMVLRAAELFLLGAKRSGEAGTAADRDALWDAIDKNLDGLLAFFHLLMTRDRIPLIDYEFTFPSHHFSEFLGDLAIPVHVDREVYSLIKAEGQAKIEQRRSQLSKLPDAMVADIADELGKVGYEWYPDVEVDLPREHRIIATFILGGVIFGAYAQASGSDHVLQSKRARLFAQLTVPQNEDPLWGFKQEQELFRRLQDYIARDERLRTSEFAMPPSVLPLLLSEEPRPRSPRELLDRALTLRASPIGDAYRAWHRKLREAWSSGRRDADAESAVAQVCQVVKQRTSKGSEIDKDQKSDQATRIDVGIGASVGIAK